MSDSIDWNDVMQETQSSPLGPLGGGPSTGLPSLTTVSGMDDLLQMPLLLLRLVDKLVQLPPGGSVTPPYQEEH